MACERCKTPNFGYTHIDLDPDAGSCAGDFGDYSIRKDAGEIGIHVGMGREEANFSLKANFCPNCGEPLRKAGE
jgi:hypothetical protein